MEQSINGLDAVDMALKVANRELSPVEIVEAHLDQIDKLNPSLNSIVVLADDAIDKAKKAENDLNI